MSKGLPSDSLSLLRPLDSESPPLPASESLLLESEPELELELLLEPELLLLLLDPESLESESLLELDDELELELDDELESPFLRFLPFPFFSTVVFFPLPPFPAALSLAASFA